MAQRIELALVEQVISSARIVRDLVNIRRRHRAIMIEPPRYSTICSAMDTVGDTSQALRAYAEAEVTGKDGAYLVAYGALHALYLQQDAAFWLCKLLDIVPMKTFRDPGQWARTVPALGAARTARNNSIGHPVRRDRGGPLASYFIVQNTLGPDGFQVIEHTKEGHKFVTVNLARLAEEQLAAMVALLDDAAQQLRSADNAHKRAFMEQKLAFIFDGLQHAVSKLGASRDADNRAMMPGYVDHIRDGLARFQAALIARQEPFEDDLRWSYRKLDRSLRVLDDHLREADYADPDLADVAADFIYHELERLKGYAQEIDDDYAEGMKNGPNQTDTVSPKQDADDRHHK